MPNFLETLSVIKFAILEPPITPVKIIPVTIPTALQAFEVIFNFSKIPRAAPAPILHIKILAKYWYKPSLTLSGAVFLTSSPAILSAAKPLAIPPTTGITPYIDK